MIKLLLSAQFVYAQDNPEQNAVEDLAPLNQEKWDALSADKQREYVDLPYGYTKRLIERYEDEIGEISISKKTTGMMLRLSPILEITTVQQTNVVGSAHGKLCPEDQILAVNGQFIDMMEKDNGILNNAVKLITSSPNDVVDISAYRPSEKRTFTVTLTLNENTEYRNKVSNAIKLAQGSFSALKQQLVEAMEAQNSADIKVRHSFTLFQFMKNKMNEADLIRQTVRDAQHWTGESAVECPK